MTTAEHYELQRTQRASYRARYLAGDPEIVEVIDLGEGRFVTSGGWVRTAGHGMDAQIDACGNRVIWCAIHDLEFESYADTCVECHRAPRCPDDVVAPGYWRRLKHPVHLVNTGEMLTLECTFHGASFTDEQACRLCLEEDEADEEVEDET